MLQLKLLVEKLYHHKADLELIISIHNRHSGMPSVLNHQYRECLKNIQLYESLLKKHNDDFFVKSQR